MANPKTFGSDYERGYQAALDDILAWTERADLIDGIALKDEVAIIRKRSRSPAKFGTGYLWHDPSF